MSDIIQVRLEEMLSEVADLLDIGVFSSDELKTIMAERRVFEHLIRGDSGRDSATLDYIKHEIGLEMERRRRMEELTQGNPKLAFRKTVSCSSIVQRVHFLFQLLLRKSLFNKDAWISYISFCTQSGAVKALSTAISRGLQVFPRDADMWIIAANRFVELGDGAKARSILMKGLRVATRKREVLEQLLKLEAMICVKTSNTASLVAISELLKNDEILKISKPDRAYLESYYSDLVQTLRVSGIAI